MRGVILPSPAESSKSQSMKSPSSQSDGPTRGEKGYSALRKGWGARVRDTVDALWGYDFFVSYAQADGQEYPAQLKAALEQPKEGRGFSVFLDIEGGYRAGDDLRVMTRRRVRSSAHLLIIAGRKALLESRWVRREVEHYLEAQALRERDRVPIIIDIDDALDYARTQPKPSPCVAQRDDLDDWLRIEECPDGDGPSGGAVRKLVNSHEGVRRESLRARVFGLLALIFLVLAVGASILAGLAWLAHQSSRSNLADARLNLAESWRREGRLNRGSAYAAAALAVRDTDASRQFLLENPPATLVDVIPVPDGPVSAVAVSTGGLLAVGDQHGRVRLIDLLGGSHAPKRKYQLDASEIGKLAFSRNGDAIAATQLDGAVWRFEVDRATVSEPVYRTDTAGAIDPLVLNQIAFLADGRLAIVADGNGGNILQLLGPDARAANTPLDVTLQAYGVSDMVSHPSRPRVAILYAGGAISMVDLGQGRPAVKKEVRRGFPVGETLGGGVSGLSLAFDPGPPRALVHDHGDRWAVGLQDASLWLLKADGALLKRVAFPRPAEGSPQDDVSEVQFTPDGSRLLAFRANGALAVFRRYKEWRLERIIEGFADYGQEVITACCVGNRLAITVSSGRTEGDLVKVWDISASDRHWMLQIAGDYGPEETNVSSLAFDETGARLAVGTDNGQVLVLDRVAHAVVALSPGHYNDQKVTALAFGSGRFRDSIFSAAWGRNLQVWSLSECTERDLSRQDRRGWFFDGLRDRCHSRRQHHFGGH